MEIEYIDVDKLIPYERNPRRITKDKFEKLCKNIQGDKEFFSMRPLLVNACEEGFIVYAGNQRLKAAQHLKLKQVPCIIQNNIDADVLKKRIVLDNITHGEFDYDLLASEFDLDELLDLGMDEKDLDIFNVQEIDSTEDDSEVLEPCKDKDAITKLGDVYELNSHRLICGDSTDPDIVAKCLNGAEPILMVTDPPYGVEYDPSWRNSKKGITGKKTGHVLGNVKNDDNPNWALAYSLFPGSIAYLWHGAKYSNEVAKDLIDSDYEIINQIIWAKHHHALSRGDYHWKHEPCWYAIKKGHQHNWQGSRKETTLWEIDSFQAIGSKKAEEDERIAHSTQKPIECMSRPIRNNTTQGEGVYDCFMGSGTTLIAAEQLGRICYGIELSPAYCDIIVDRWKKYMERNSKEYTIKRNGEKI